MGTENPPEAHIINIQGIIDEAEKKFKDKFLDGKLLNAIEPNRDILNNWFSV